MNNKLRKEAMALCRAHGVRAIHQRVCREASTPEDLVGRRTSNDFGTRLTRLLALRKGLLEGDTDAMWRGLRQAVRLRWLEQRVAGYRPDSYMHMWDALDILATGEGEVFRQWLAAVPARIEDGHPYCVAISNALTAWGHGDPKLREPALSRLFGARHLSRVNKFQRACVGVLVGGFTDKPAMVRSALDDGLRDWRPVAWQPQWFYVHRLMALYNVARTMLSELPELPEHDRFIDPPVYDSPRGPDLVDFSRCAPTLHRWLADLPEQLDLDAWKVVPPPDEEGPLRAAVYAAPEDDAPRLVYADWLQSQGEPRGEFIALQLAGKLGKDDKRRMTQLAATHGWDWLSPLPRSRMGDQVYERGFVSACRVGDGPMELDANPAWATLRELHGAVPGPETPMPLLRSLGGLKTLEPVAASARPLPIESLAYVGPQTPAAPKLEPSTCPQLKELWILGQPAWVDSAQPEAFAWVLDAPLVRGLERLILPLPCAHLPRFVSTWLLARPEGFGLEQLMVSSQAGEAWDSGWQLQITRTKDGSGVELHLAKAPSNRAKHPGRFEALLEGLRALPAEQVQSLRVDSTVKKRPEFEQLSELYPKLRTAKLERRDGFWRRRR